MTRDFLRLAKKVNTHFVVLVAVAACGNDPPVPAARPQAVRVVSPQQREISQRLPYVGTVRSGSEVQILARVAGTVESLPLAEGAKVARGAVVARIEAPELVARHAQTRAEIDRVSAESDYACAVFATDQRLVDKGALTRAHLDSSKRRCLSARAAVGSAAARTAEIRSRLKERTERAPFAGRVLAHLAEPGEHVAPGRPLLLLGSDELELVVSASERDIAFSARNPGSTGGRIAEGSGVEIRVAGETVHGRVVSVAPRARGKTRTVEVRVALPPGIDAHHGMSLDVDFIVDRASSSTAVPVEAIVRREDGEALFLVEENVAVERPVTTGPIDGGWIAVSPPLPASARVVVSNLDVLRDGSRVYPVAIEGGHP